MKLTEDFKEENIERITLYQYVDALLESYITFSKDKIDNLGLTPTEAMLLIDLYSNSNVTQQYLAGKFNLSEGYTAKVLQNLENKGYVLRREDLDNRRRKLVSLTDKGKIEVLKAIDIINQWEELVCENETNENMANLKRILFNLAKQTEKF